MLFRILQVIWNNSWSFTKFVIFAGALAGAFAAIFIIMFRRHVSENWEYYKNDPNILKYSGLFHKDNPDDTWLEATQRNYNRVLTEKTRRFVRLFLQPWIGMAQGMSELSNANLLSMENMRGGFAYMRALISKIMVEILNKISGIQMAIMMILLRVREGLKKQVAIFSLLSSTIQHNYIFLWSLMNGPIGKMGDFGEAMQWFLVFMTFGAYGPPIYNSMCFHRDTLIKTPKGSLSIAQLKTGDIIGSGSNRVLATISIGRCNAGVYRINGILVSGDHLMLCPDTMRWMRVADNELAEPVEYDDELYCLITHSGIIEVEGKTRTIIFRDYIDTHDGETLTNMRKFAIEWLNKKPEPNYRDHAEEYIWGMAISTPITINSAGDTRALGDIVAGDYIWCRGELRKVKARISCAPRACPAIKWNGITISANCCVDVYGTWTRVAKLIEEGCETFIDDEPLAHLIVEGGVIEVATNDKRLLVRDFIDINTPAYNNFIDKYVEARVNIV